MWYKNVDASFFRFVTIYAFDRQTGGQTDRQTDRQKGPGNTVHCMQSRGKKTGKLSSLLTPVAVRRRPEYGYTNSPSISSMLSTPPTAGWIGNAHQVVIGEHGWLQPAQDDTDGHIHQRR